MLNQISVGRVVSAGNHFAINIDPEYAHLRDELVSYCSALFANIPETLQLAVYEAPAFTTKRRPTTPGQGAWGAEAPCTPRLRSRPGAGWLNIDYKPGDALGYDPANGFLSYDVHAVAFHPLRTIPSRWLLKPLLRAPAARGGDPSHEGCKRALRDGGVARFQMPNFALAFRSYCANGREYLEAGLAFKLMEHMPAYARNDADMISHTVYQSYTHKYIWDEESLTKALLELGYRDVEVVRAPGNTHVEPHCSGSCPKTITVSG